MLADVYYHALEVRRNTPASFQTLVASLGIFKYNPIISNEELETIKSISRVETMPVFPGEILMGSERCLSQ